MRKKVSCMARRAAEDTRIHSFGFKVYKIKMGSKYMTRYGSLSGGLYVQRKDVLKHCADVKRLSVASGLTYAQCSLMIETNDGSVSRCKEQIRLCSNSLD